MADNFEKIKQELSIFYPDVTDSELNEITNNLIKFFALSAKAIYRSKLAPKDDDLNSLTDNDVTNSD